MAAVVRMQVTSVEVGAASPSKLFYDAPRGRDKDGAGGQRNPSSASADRMSVSSSAPPANSRPISSRTIVLGAPLLMPWALSVDVQNPIAWFLLELHCVVPVEDAPPILFQMGASILMLATGAIMALCGHMLLTRGKPRQSRARNRGVPPALALNRRLAAVRFGERRKRWSS